jgi:hypothetical protein
MNPHLAYVGALLVLALPECYQALKLDFALCDLA